MDKKIRKKLLSDTFEEPYEAVREIVSQNEITIDTIEFMLKLQDHLVISEFITNIKVLPKNSVASFEVFIKKNLEDSDGLFVSDLIDFASHWRINIMEECLEFASNPKYNDNVVLSSINYIFDNIDYKYIKEIFKVFILVKENPEFHQNAQVTSLFYLFRLSHDEKYLNELIDLIKNGQPFNKEILSNILKWEFNRKKYFKPHNLLEEICK